MSDPEYIDPRQLQSGPIRHASLSAEVMTQVKAVIDVLGPYLDTTLEQYEINLMWDLNPEAEVGINADHSQTSPRRHRSPAACTGASLRPAELSGCLARRPTAD